MGRRKLEHNSSVVVVEENLKIIPEKPNVRIELRQYDETFKTFDSKNKFQIIDVQPREQSTERRSSRPIRRKKFDDELIDDSSLYKKKKLDSFSRDSDGNHDVTTGIIDIPALKTPDSIRKQASDNFFVHQKQKSVRIRSPTISSDKDDDTSEDEHLITKVCERSEFPKPHMFDDTAYFWTPEDDLALITNMIQTCDPIKVHEETQFSQNFSLDDIIERWSLLLYDRVTSNITIESIRQLHKSIIHSIEKQSLFSPQEDAILKQVPSKAGFAYENFEKLLSNNQGVFLLCREPLDLFKRWFYLYSKYLLNNQSTLRQTKLSILNSKPTIHPKLSNSSIKELEEKQFCLKNLLDRKICEFRILQAEINRLMLLASTVSGVNALEFEHDVYAYLRGSRVRYLIKTCEVTLGRSTKEIKVDCDLTHEGYSKRISRFQAVINLLPMGRFLIYNSGTHRFTVNTEIVEPDSAAELLDESVLQFDDLIFLFRINRPLIAKEFDLFNDRSRNKIVLSNLQP